MMVTQLKHIYTPMILTGICVSEDRVNDLAAGALATGDNILVISKVDMSWRESL
jgi:hypothetical protein